MYIYVTYFIFSFGPSLHGIGLLFMPDRFLNPVQKMLRSTCMHVYRKPGKHPNLTISCQDNFITSIIFVVFVD